MNWRIIAIALAIPLLLTATVFAGTSRGNFSIEGGNSNNNAISQEVNVQTTAPDDGIQVASALSSKTHNIKMSAEVIPENGLLGYRMVSYNIVEGSKTTNIISKYPTRATIPGPTIVLTEGDKVNLILVNNINATKLPSTKIPSDPEFQRVSVHVHGVHYNTTSDGTLMHINNIGDQGALFDDTFSYQWIAGAGTAGSWPYHDHTFGGINGAEHHGLFGMVIVNPASGKVQTGQSIGNGKVNTTPVTLNSISKDFVIYMGDDAFWATEIGSDGKQRALWTNPTLVAGNNQNVRFHIIAIGTDVPHEFNLDKYKFLDPGTKTLLSSKKIGPLENLEFVIKAKTGTSTYKDLQPSNDLMGMEGQFNVVTGGGPSIASAVPGPF